MSTRESHGFSRGRDVNDLEICWLHGLDPNDEENPEQAMVDRGLLQEYRDYYRSIGRRPGLD